MKIRVFEAFAGYGSQALALKQLQEDFPDKVEFEFVGISEIDTYAIAAYNALHGYVPNFGDITQINWGGKCLTLTYLPIRSLAKIFRELVIKKA